MKYKGDSEDHVEYEEDFEVTAGDDPPGHDEGDDDCDDEQNEKVGDEPGEVEREVGHAHHLHALSHLLLLLVQKLLDQSQKHGHQRQHYQNVDRILRSCTNAVHLVALYTHARDPRLDAPSNHRSIL